MNKQEVIIHSSKVKELAHRMRKVLTKYNKS